MIVAMCVLNRLSWRQCLRIVIRSIGAGAALFLVCALALEFTIGANAGRALREYYDDSADSIIRPPIPVYELAVSKDRTYPGPFLFDVFINSSYCSTPEAQSSEAVGTSVFHFFNWEYDGYCLPMGRNEVGDEILCFVDMTFARFATLSSCGLACLLLTIVIGVLQLRSEQYSIRRDRIDENLEAAFANASHELKTPLMAIRGYVDALQCHAIDEDFALARIAAASERMYEMIDGILRISRLDSGLKKPVLAMWDVREIIYDEARMIEEDCRKDGVDLIMDLPRPLWFPCDRAMISTIVLNILSNACRHAENFIHISEGNSVNGEIELFIDNDGHPPSQSTVAHAFDRFYKGDGGNTGIGLALSKEYVELMGGEIEIQPLSRGTRIRIRL